MEKDKTDELFGIENWEKTLHRNSQDTKSTNERGLTLLEWCKAYDLLILNGRKTGDIFGCYTSFQWNGSRVVDYVITSHSSFSQTTQFKVGEYRPWLSDHCPLLYNIHIKKKKVECNTQPTNALKEAPLQYLWDSASSTEFEKYLGLETTRGEFETMMQRQENEHPANFAANLTNIILQSASNCGIKRKKPKKAFSRNNAPWFDKECENTKKELKSLANALKHSPNEVEIRQQIFFTKRKLHSLIKKKEKCIPFFHNRRNA